MSFAAIELALRAAAVALLLVLAASLFRDFRNSTAGRLAVALALGQMRSSWSADLVEGRRRLRIFIVAAIALYGGLNAVLQMLALRDDAAEIANIANIGVLTGIVAAICVAMMQVTAGELFPAA